MKKISFICMPGLDQFIDPIIEKLSNDYMVRKYIIRTEQDIINAIECTDIIFFEWANQSAVIGTNYIWEQGIKGKKVIVRLHSYEIFTSFPKQINWPAVDKLIFVAPHIRDILKESIPNIEEKVKTEVIYNGVDIDKIPFKKREPGFNLAWVGYINYKKNPPMALQVMKKLVDIDKRYMLHVAGSFQDLRYKVYLEYMIKEMGLQDNVKFYGWVDDMEGFWEDKNYLLHVSIHEGHSYAINESLIRGIVPIIHNFRGAKELYPIDIVFNTIDEAIDKIIGKCYNIRGYRDWVVKNNWTLKNQLVRIKQIIEGL